MDRFGTRRSIIAIRSMAARSDIKLTLAVRGIPSSYSSMDYDRRLELGWRKCAVWIGREDHESIERIARVQGVSRSDVVRRCVTWGVEDMLKELSDE
jgi:hypothetical protein